MKPEIKVYERKKNLRLGSLLGQSLKDMYTSRFLARQLAVRDIKGLYRQSFFGILWAFITPLATALVWVVLNKTGTVRLSPTGIPYPVYAMTGTLLWSIITEAVNAPLKTTNSAKGIISKINFPKEALIITGIYKLLFNSAINIVLLVFFVFFFGVGYHHSMWLFPLAIIGALFFGTTLGLLITPLGMLYKDVARMISMGFQFLMYATPVVYAIPKSGILKTLMEWNPFSPFILTGRDLLTGMPPTYLSYFVWVLIVSIPLFFMALVIYRISIPIIIERLSS